MALIILMRGAEASAKLKLLVVIQAAKYGIISAI